jgi:hypothetical protein
MLGGFLSANALGANLALPGNESISGAWADIPEATEVPGPASYDAALPGPETDTPSDDAQFGNPNISIFRRFAGGRETSHTWQTMFEVPVGVYPQTAPNAHVLVNEGLNWVTSYLPLNRVYFGRSIGYAHMEWEPGGQLDTIEVVEWSWTEILNIAVRPWWVISFGAGAGFMDGMIFFKDGSFVHRFEVFVPAQIGTGFRLGQTWFLGFKLAQSSYFGPGPVASATRSLVGLGYNY